MSTGFGVGAFVMRSDDNPRPFWIPMCFRSNDPGSGLKFAEKVWNSVARLPLRKSGDKQLSSYQRHEDKLPNYLIILLNGGIKRLGPDYPAGGRSKPHEVTTSGIT